MGSESLTPASYPWLRRALVCREVLVGQAMMSYLRIARRGAVHRSEGAKDEAVQNEEEEEVKATGDRRGTSRQLMRPV